MNTNTAYLLGMVLGNGEIQDNQDGTFNITIDIPFKNLITDKNEDVTLYIEASLFNIRDYIDDVIYPARLRSTKEEHAIKLSFTLEETHPFITILFEYIESGNKQQNFVISPLIYDLSHDCIRSLLKGLADVTGYMRRSNIAYGKWAQHRVYIEVPQNWYMVICIANLLKCVDVPVQTIDFAHPNFRDAHLIKYNEGKPDYWKKEHQIKIWANEFLPIGFNIKHKEEALERYAHELELESDLSDTHKYYWQKTVRRRKKPEHPGEYDPSLPSKIRGKHYESWTDLAKDLGYHE